MAEIRDGQGEPYRAFVCQTLNPPSGFRRRTAAGGSIRSRSPISAG